MPKILLVEDDPFIAEIYSKKLEASDFEVQIAQSGREVMRKVAAERYDLILLDMVIPEMSGLEVLQELKSKPEYHGQHVIIFSNLSGPEERAEAEKAGANGFIIKSDFTPTQAVEEIKRIMNGFGAIPSHQVPKPSVHETVSPAENISSISIEDGK